MELQAEALEGSSRVVGAEADLSLLAAAVVAGGSGALTPSAPMETEAGSSSERASGSVASPLWSHEAEWVESPVGTVAGAKSAESTRGLVVVGVPRLWPVAVAVAAMSGVSTPWLTPEEVAASSPPMVAAESPMTEVASGRRRRQAVSAVPRRDSALPWAEMHSGSEATDFLQRENSTATQAPKKPAAVEGHPAEVEVAVARFRLEAVVGHPVAVEVAVARFRLEAGARRGVGALRTVKATRHMWAVARHMWAVARRKGPAARRTRREGPAALRTGRVRHRTMVARRTAPEEDPRRGPVLRPPSLRTAGRS